MICGDFHITWDHSLKKKQKQKNNLNEVWPGFSQMNKRPALNMMI